MRDYAKLSPQFWIGKTGKRLRQKGTDAQLVALYLISSPHANMLGLYYLPMVYIAHETGLPIDRVEKGMQECIEVEFCAYDSDTELIWIFEAARFQIAERLSPNDKQARGVANELLKLPSSHLVTDFAERYGDAFHLPFDLLSIDPFKVVASPFEAPSKPRTGAGTRTEEKTIRPQPSATAPPADGLPDCPHQAILALYGEKLAELRQPRAWEGARAVNLKARWRWVLTAKKPDGQRYATTAEEALEFFGRMFAYVAKSDFLMGRNGQWTCDLPWLVTAENFSKVIEGKYENHSKEGA